MMKWGWRAIASGSSRPFEPIIEDTSLDSSETSMASGSEASVFMGDFFNPDVQTQPPLDQVGRFQFDIRLEYVRNNIYGASLYSNPLNRLTVKIEDVSSPLEPEVWVNYQGDQYVSLIGTRYMLTPLFELMDSTGIIHPAIEGRTFSNPNLARIPQGLHTGQQMRRAGYAPSAPPLPTQGQEQVSSKIPIYPLFITCT